MLSHQRQPQSNTLPGHQAIQRSAQSVRHFVDAKHRLVTVKFGKKLTFDEVERYVSSLQADPTFEPTFSEITDLSEVEEIDVDANQFLKLADKVDPFSVGAKRAFVAKSSLQSHAARMHKILRAQRNFEIFSTLEAAEDWIRG